MSRFTNATAVKAARKPATRNGDALKTSKKANAVTGNGAAGYSYKDKTALFLLSVTNFTGQNAFYESGTDRDARFIDLITKVAQKDAEFVANLLKWLRGEGNIRTAAIIGAIEYGRVVSGTHLADGREELTPRAVLRSVLQRADEPSEALGYWLSKYGQKTPRWFQRALGDAARDLYSERSVLKYDSQGDKVRFGDVISLSSVQTEGYKAQVFKFALDRRYGNVNPEGYEGLNLLEARKIVDAVPVAQRAKFLKDHPEQIEAAGYNWEHLAGWLGTALTADFWEALIPKMGYMALIRNLRNFAKVEISQKSVDLVAKRIADEEEVAKSRQLPMRFISSYRAINPDDASQGSYWGHTPVVNSTFSSVYGRKFVNKITPALSTALDLSLKSVPVLSGQNVIMIDISGSMSSGMSEKSSVTYYENAVTFGVALALKNPDSVLYAFNGDLKEVKLVRGGSLLDNIAHFKDKAPLSGGTSTVDCAEKALKLNPEAERLVVITDEQTSPSQGSYGYGYGYGGSRSNKTFASIIPDDVTMVSFNLGGYAVAQAPSGTGNFHVVAGLTDAGFQMLSTLDSAKTGSFPWEISGK